MKLTLDSDVLAFAFIKPTKDVYKERFEEFKKHCIRRLIAYTKM